MAMVLASDWFSLVANRKCNRCPLVAKGIAGSGNRKSRGLGWETADQGEKGIVGSGNRKSRDLKGETAGECEKGIAGSQTAGETAGAKSKVQVGRRG